MHKGCVYELWQAFGHCVCRGGAVFFFRAGGCRDRGGFAAVPYTEDCRRCVKHV